MALYRLVSAISRAMSQEYVAGRNGGYSVKDTRVSLDSVVYAFLRGEAPEGIAVLFSAIGLEDIFGETLCQESRRSHPALHAELAEARLTIRRPMPLCRRVVDGST